MKNGIKPRQNFNYHTHTYRCGHAKPNGKDEEYIEYAIKCGMKKIAFTDHIPLPNNNFPNSRMDMSEIEEYLNSIKLLQKKYQGVLDIESGFEFEYYYRARDHFLRMRDLVNKMIVGQHFVIDDNNIETRIYRTNGMAITDDVLKLYLERIYESINLGLVDIIAHPDLFMQARESFGSQEETITRQLCQIAVENDIPLEINMGKIFYSIANPEKTIHIPYPDYNFWKIVAEETLKYNSQGRKLKVLYGKDAHFPEDLGSELCYEYSDRILGDKILSTLNFTDKELNVRKKIRI